MRIAWLSGMAGGRRPIAGAALAIFAALGCAREPETGTAPPSSGTAASAAAPVAPGKGVVEIEDAREFEAVVLKSSVPVLVDFYATWCGPCRIQAPIVERLAEKAGGAYAVAKLDVDRVRELSARYKIEGLPTLIVFAGGREKKRFLGLTREDDLATALAAAGRS